MVYLVGGVALGLNLQDNDTDGMDDNGESLRSDCGSGADWVPPSAAFFCQNGCSTGKPSGSW